MMKPSINTTTSTTVTIVIFINRLLQMVIEGTDHWGWEEAVSDVCLCPLSYWKPAPGVLVYGCEVCVLHSTMSPRKLCWGQIGLQMYLLRVGAR